MTHLMTRPPDPPPPHATPLRGVTDDEQLLRRVARGEVPAQEQLWRAHVDAVYRVCASQVDPHAAEDATAETFLAAFRSAEAYDSTRGTVRAWLLGIAVNQVRRGWRADRALTGAIGRLVHRDRAAVVSEDHADAVIARVDAGRLRDGLGRLSPSDRLLLVTQASGDLSPGELGAALGITAGAAKVRLHRARRRLARLLDPSLPTD